MGQAQPLRRSHGRLQEKCRCCLGCCLWLHADLCCCSLRGSVLQLLAAPARHESSNTGKVLAKRMPKVLQNVLQCCTRRRSQPACFVRMKLCWIHFKRFHALQVNLKALAHDVYIKLPEAKLTWVWRWQRRLMMLFNGQMMWLRTANERGASGIWTQGNGCLKVDGYAESCSWVHRSMTAASLYRPLCRWNGKSGLIAWPVNKYNVV